MSTWNYGGREITTNETGFFVFNEDGIDLEFVSLKETKAAIDILLRQDKTTLSLEALDDKGQLVHILGVNRGTSALRTKESHAYSLYMPGAWVALVLKERQRLQEELHALNQRLRVALLPEYIKTPGHYGSHLDVSEYPAAVKQLQLDYAAVLAAVQEEERAEAQKP